MIVAVPAALVEQQLEATLRVLIVIFDKLLLREAVDHHEQHEFREWLSSRAIASFGLLQLFLDQPEGAIELKIIRLTIGTPSIVDLPLRFDTIPSRPILQAWANTVGP